jgi:DNA end-binding protein Ku
MRAIWKGHIRFSLVTIPIRIYNAIDTAHKIQFNQLNSKTNNPIKYQKVDKDTGDVVDKDDIVKGYQYEPGQYVIVDQEDFDKVKLKSTRIIEIEGFVKQDEIHTTLYDSPYFIGPDGEVAAQAYDLLAKTLKDSGKLGVGRVVLRDREAVVLLSPQEKGMVMYKLRYPEEVRAMDSVPEIDDVKIDKDQLKLSKTLVDSMTKDFSKMVFKDRYHDALREMIQQKIDGEEIVTYEEEEKPVVDIMTALKASIEQAKEKKKPMKKATGKKATKTSKKAAKAS